MKHKPFTVGIMLQTLGKIPTEPAPFDPVNGLLSEQINQNGVGPGSKKLEQFKQALKLRNTPALYSQDGKGDQATVYVKLFDPCGSWTWYLTEWDGDEEAFGLVKGFEAELGYISLRELAFTAGAMGIGIEIDTWFKPRSLAECRKA